MTVFDIITIFPDIFKSYFKESIIKRAQQKKLIKINIHNLRNFTKDKHRTVDDRPYGGGPGMILKIEPIYKAVKEIRKNKRLSNKKRKVILLSAKGNKLDQKLACNLSKLDQLILICGRYEGVDERVAKHIADMEISIGDYVLTGGELPAMVVVDTVARLIPGVIKEESLREESFKPITNNRPRTRASTVRDRQPTTNLEYPQYTRPEVFSLKKRVNWKVPKVLLSGHHKKIEEWRQKRRKLN